MKRTLKAIAFVGVFALVLGLGVAQADDYVSGDNAANIGANTMTWTGQGASGGELNTIDCDAENTGYLLWVFTTDGGSAQDATLHLGTTAGGNELGDFAADTNTGSTFKFVTPYYAPDTNTLYAYVDFTTVEAGTGSWELVISHGCPGEAPEAALPTVTKDAKGSYDDTFTWDIKKQVDKTYVEIQTAGGTATFNYTVTVHHGASAVSNVVVAGNITVTNDNDDSLTLSSITDKLSTGLDCTVDTSGGLTVPHGDTEFPYSCDLGDTVPTGDVTNSATIKWDEQTLTDGHLAAGEDTTTTGVISFAANEIDDCVDVSDPIDSNSPHTFCVGDTGDPTFSFTYSRTVNAPPLGQCVSYDNTATFTTNDTDTTGSASQTVRVCRFNAPLTIGYWKTHMHVCLGKEKQATAGCSSSGPFTGTYLGRTICAGCATVGILGGYDARTEPKALGVFNANNCSSSMTDANAAACLAAQLLAAELNVANGANTCICDTIKKANALLTAINYQGPGQPVTFSVTNTRAYAISLKTALDRYNNNLGCPA